MAGKRKVNPGKDSVWIEFEPTRDDAEGVALAAKAQKLIRQLTRTSTVEVRWSESRKRLDIGWDPMSWQILSDWGTWLDLDFILRD